jgi:hypothetical protein
MLLVLGGQLILAVGFTLTQDAQYSWAMFASVVHFDVRYDWVLKNGSLRRHLPGEELRGRARQLVGDRGTTLYQVGSTRRFVVGYLRYLAQHAPPEDAAVIRASLRFRQHGQKDWTLIELYEPIRRHSLARQ